MAGRSLQTDDTLDMTADVPTSGSGHYHGTAAEGVSVSAADVGHAAYFHISYNTVLLFEKWTTDSWGTLFASCLAVMVFAVLAELMNVGRLKLSRISVQQMQDYKGWCASACGWVHLVQTLLQVSQVFLHYSLMMVFMTLNVPLCAAILIGVALGYFFFRVPSPQQSYESL